MLRLLAVLAVLPAAATVYFAVFWRWFAFFRRHRALSLAMMTGSLAALGAAVVRHERALFARGVTMPLGAVVAGWMILIAANVLGLVADRQIKLHVRSFGPFFEPGGRIDLVTDGAYGVVRHPIYAAGIYFQLGVFLVTGRFAVALALVVFAIGAAWFTRQEERRLVELLDDPEAYEAYRARVPALVPGWPARRRRGEAARGE